MPDPVPRWQKGGRVGVPLTGGAGSLDGEDLQGHRLGHLPEDQAVDVPWPGHAWPIFGAVVISDTVGGGHVVGRGGALQHG